MKRETRKTVIKVDGDLHYKVKTVAVQTRRTLQDCTDEALRQWLEEQRRQADKAG